MFHARSLSALPRAAADVRFKRFMSHRRLRSTVTPTSTAQTGHGGARSRGGSERPGRSRTGGGQRGGTAAAAANEISVDFEQTREAYRSKDSLELLRSLVVFKLCSYDFLVDKNKEVMRCNLTLNVLLDVQTTLWSQSDTVEDKYRIIENKEMKEQTGVRDADIDYYNVILNNNTGIQIRLFFLLVKSNNQHTVNVPFVYLYLFMLSLR